MRKLKLQMQMSADGFVAGPAGELDWMQIAPVAEQIAHLTELTQNMDTILMGRKMAGGFTTYWESVVDNQPESPEYPYAKIFVDTPKIVFSKTESSLPGRNVTIENGNLSETVKKLKQQSGKDLIVYGGADFVSHLIKENLIDELHLFVNPVAIGNGLKIFTERTKLNLLNSIHCLNGIVINIYQPNN